MSKATRPILFLLLVVLVGLATWQSYRMIKPPSAPSFPEVDDVDRVAFHIFALHPEDDPKPLDPQRAADKEIIEKILRYLQTAKSEGYDHQVPTVSVPTNFLVIELKDGSAVTLETAAKNRVYVAMNKTGKTIRVRSPELSNWLYIGWKDDLTLITEEKAKQIAVSGCLTMETSICGKSATGMVDRVVDFE